MTFKKTILAIALLFAVFVANAQSPTQPEVPAEKRALVQELLQTTGSANLSKQILARLRESMKPEGPDQREAFDRFFDKLDIDELQDQMIEMYARHFTDEELISILAFYKSPAGQKYIHELPSLLNESMTLGQDWATSKVAEVRRELKQEKSKSSAGQ